MRHNIYILVAALLLADVYLWDDGSVYAWLWSKMLWALGYLDKAFYFI